MVCVLDEAAIQVFGIEYICDELGMSWSCCVKLFKEYPYLHHGRSVEISAALAKKQKARVETVISHRGHFMVNCGSASDARTWGMFLSCMFISENRTQLHLMFYKTSQDSGIYSGQLPVLCLGVHAGFSVC